MYEIQGLLKKKWCTVGKYDRGQIANTTLKIVVGWRAEAPKLEAGMTDMKVKYNMKKLVYLTPMCSKEVPHARQHCKGYRGETVTPLHSFFSTVLHGLIMAPIY